MPSFSAAWRGVSRAAVMGCDEVPQRVLYTLLIEGVAVKTPCDCNHSTGVYPDVRVPVNFPRCTRGRQFRGRFDTRLQTITREDL